MYVPRVFWFIAAKEIRLNYRYNGGVKPGKENVIIYLLNDMK